MILRLALNAAVHTAGGIVLGALAVGTAAAIYRAYRCEQHGRDHDDYYASPVQDAPSRPSGPVSSAEGDPAASPTEMSDEPPMPGEESARPV